MSSTVRDVADVDALGRGVGAVGAGHRPVGPNGLEHAATGAIRPADGQARTDDARRRVVGGQAGVDHGRPRGGAGGKHDVLRRESLAGDGTRCRDVEERPADDHHSRRE